MEISKDEALQQILKWRDASTQVVVTGYVKGSKFVVTFMGVIQMLEGTQVLLLRDSETAMSVLLDEAVHFESLSGEEVVNVNPFQRTEKELVSGIVMHGEEERWSCSIYEVRQE
jgi:hypothetical protein